MIDRIIQLWRRIIFYLRRDKFERELEDEMRFHLEMKVEENLFAGMDQEEARYAAQRQFGNRTLLKEVSREMWRFRWLETVWQDLRCGVRMLLKQPGFTFVAVLSLALGIGANSTIYSVVHSVLLRPLQVQEPDRLMVLSTNIFSFPLYSDFYDRNTVMSGLAAYSAEQFSLNVNGRAEFISGSFVSTNYFDVLEVQPVPGRAFLPEEGRTPATHPVAVISHSLWQRVYGGDPNVVGKNITLNNVPLTVIGVAPKGFRGISLIRFPEVYVPIQMLSPLATGELLRLRPEMRGWSWLAVFGRLREDISLEQAQAEMNLLADSIKQAYPNYMSETFSVPLIPVTTQATGMRSRKDIERFIAILAAVVGMVLLIACANVANLLLARANHRRKEIAVRLALGASRSRVIRQLLTESVLLAIAGGVLGLVLSLWAMESLKAFELPGRISLAQLGLGLSRDVLIFTIVVSALSIAAFGLVPALQTSRPDLVSAIKGQFSFQSGRSKLRSGFLVVQVGLCLVLLIGAGLFIKSLRNALVIDPGFETEKIAFVSTNLGLQRYTEEVAGSFYQQSVERVAALPGVQSASWTTSPQLASSAPYNLYVSYEGYEPESGGIPEAEFNYVGEEYFDTMGLELVRGRSFTEMDRAGTSPVALINETVAERYFSGIDPVGRSLRVGKVRSEIIGVMRNSKYHSLNEGPRPYIYVPLKQNLSSVGLETMTMVVRTTGDPAPVINNVAGVLKALDPNLPLTGVKTMQEHISGSLMAQRFGSLLLGLFSLLTLVLASLGIYGVVAYLVGQSTREIGIRRALGAQGTDVLRLMLLKSMLPIAIGIGIGMGLAVLMARTTSSFLYGISTNDPVIFVGAVLLLGTASLLASYIPVRRAVRVDPVVALRNE